MTQFNIQRMKQYAQWQLATHRATLLKITGVATSAFILMFLFVKYVSHRDLQTQSDDLTLLWIGCFAFCGVQVFPNLLSKQERTSLLMLPASNAEKFLTSYIGVLLTAFVVPLVSFFVADLKFNNCGTTLLSASGASNVDLSGTIRSLTKNVGTGSNVKEEKLTIGR